MSYLYLEPEILEKLFLRPTPLHDVFCILFREYILQEKEKKTLILDTRRILRNFQKLSFEVKDLSLSCSSSFEAFFLNVVTLFQLRKGEIPSSQLREFYFRKFSGSFSLSVKEKNFSALSRASSSPFAIPEKVREFEDVYLSLLLEVPRFLIRDYGSFLSVSERKDILSSYWHKPVDFYLPSRKKEGLVRLEDGFLLSTKKEENDIRTFYPFEIALSSLSLPRLQPKVLLSSSCPDYAFFSLSSRLSSSLPVLDKARGLEDDPASLDEKSLVCRFSPRDYDLVLLMGKDNRLSYNESQFLLPRLTEERLSSSKQSVLSSLRSYCGFVKKGGYLVYVSESVSSYETLLVRNAFFEEHEKEFESVRSRFSLPSEVGSRAGYFMIFRRIV